MKSPVSLPPHQTLNVAIIDFCQSSPKQVMSLGISAPPVVPGQRGPARVDGGGEDLASCCIALRTSEVQNLS